MGDKTTIKTQKSLKFTSEETTKLIDFVQQHKLFENARHRTATKDKLWDEISAALGKDGTRQQINK